MTSLDSELERKRLADLYSEMSDAKLESLAGDAAGLTDLARSVLSSELMRRGLNAQLSENVGKNNGNSESNDLITIRLFQDLHDADLMKGMIESAGIECFLADAYMVGRIGRVRLQVQRADVEAANEILNLPIPESFEVDGVGEYRQPRCPVCGSLDVSFEGWSQSMGDTLTSAGLIAAHQDSWKCQACRNVWPAKG